MNLHPRGMVNISCLFGFFLVPYFAKVRSWPSCEVNDQVLVWYHCDGAEPQWSVPEQTEVTTREWVYRGRTEHLINAHIQVRGGALSTCLSILLSVLSFLMFSFGSHQF